jgi:hypothetical protein
LPAFDGFALISTFLLMSFLSSVEREINTQAGTLSSPLKIEFSDTGKVSLWREPETRGRACRGSNLGRSGRVRTKRSPRSLTQCRSGALLVGGAYPAATFVAFPFRVSDGRKRP